jgi:hypothetical protein
MQPQHDRRKALHGTARHGGVRAAHAACSVSCGCLVRLRGDRQGSAGATGATGGGVQVKTGVGVGRSVQDKAGAGERH